MTINTDFSPGSARRQGFLRSSPTAFTRANCRRALSIRASAFLRDDDGGFKDFDGQGGTLMTELQIDCMADTLTQAEAIAAAVSAAMKKLHRRDGQSHRTAHFARGRVRRIRTKSGGRQTPGLAGLDNLASLRGYKHDGLYRRTSIQARRRRRPN